MPEQLLSMKETSKATGLGKTKLTELVLAGEIRSMKVGRRRLVPQSAVDEFIRREITEQNRHHGEGRAVGVSRRLKAL